MRWLIPLGALAALAFAQTAAAAPVSVAEVKLAPHFQRTLERHLGVSEGPILQAEVADAVSRALTRAGADVAPGAAVTVEATILDADPNRPTMKQVDDHPGLSVIDSVSTGGARLNAVIRGADGRVIAEVSHERYSQSLGDLVGQPAEWTDANRAIRQFAEKVADAYVANAR